jgi:hypothetical protein
MVAWSGSKLLMVERQSPRSGMGGRGFLDVPYAEKDETKALGARWDAAVKRRFDPRPPTPELQRWAAARADVPDVLPGEDRESMTDAESALAESHPLPTSAYGRGVTRGAKRSDPKWSGAVLEVRRETVVAGSGPVGGTPPPFNPRVQGSIPWGPPGLTWRYCCVGDAAGAVMGSERGASAHTLLVLAAQRRRQKWPRGSVDEPAEVLPW